jgi:hypothetical protein
VIERMARSGCRVISVEDYLSLATMLDRETKSRSAFSGGQIITDLAAIAERGGAHVVLINHTKPDEKNARSYGEGQIGAKAQSNLYVRSERDSAGRVQATVIHVKENRFNSQADVDIPFVLSVSDHTLVAGKIALHRSRGKRSRGVEDGRDF